MHEDGVTFLFLGDKCFEYFGGVLVVLECSACLGAGNSKSKLESRVVLYSANT